ncbi:hypothetical protein AMECASPLE_000945 [Ameca splendens]|uniref:Uncharacterized protein n=1 Tax=Ameca splendens TaxID=208324 RepID=A0ABV0ZHK7_9TELE
MEVAPGGDEEGSSCVVRQTEEVFKLNRRDSWRKATQRNPEVHTEPYRKSCYNNLTVVCCRPAFICNAS